MFQRVNAVFFLSVLFYLAFLAHSLVVGMFRFYGSDIIALLFLIIILRLLYRPLNLNVPVYTLVVLSLSTHISGMFGWYNVSPVPLQWDHITHFTAIFSLSLVLFCAAGRFMKRFWSLRTWGILGLLFLAGLGIGSVIESIEFGGFLMLGFGEGGFRLGGPGDGIPEDVSISTAKQLEEFGGGYFNTELDLLWNTAGALLALIICSFLKFSLRFQQFSCRAPCP